MGIREPRLLFFCLVLVSVAPAYGAGQAATVSPLAARGYIVLPEPQRTELGERDFRFGPDWRQELSGVPANDAAAGSLRDDLESRFHIALGGSGKALRLAIVPNSVTIGAAADSNKETLAREAYRMDLSAGGITVTANASAGLFYGVQTLIQLIRPRDGALWLPEGRITDWPDLEARFIYWDDAHHLERLDELKRAMRTAAFFKANGFVIKLEGHFQFKSAPAIVEPQALSPAQLQELTDYGLKFHIQLIPYLDGPGHIAFILKHPEYAKLREFPESNYELCVTNEDSYKLLLGMFQDLMDANKGVNYMFLSTDEAYYVGLADNPQCQETGAARQAGSVGKLLAQFVTRTANYLHDRGRTILFWGEYPMKPEDISALPSHLVNGETYGPAFDPAFRKQGIRSMFYTSSEGEEKLFPSYYTLPGARVGGGGARIAGTFQKISFDPARQQADLMGSLNAGWADMGLHPETFWLGYATATAAAWHPGWPDPRESASAFYPLFYGPGATNMTRIYQLMSYQAQLWTQSWDTVTAGLQKPLFGGPYEIYRPPHPRREQMIPLPAVPLPQDLSCAFSWTLDNAKRLQPVAGAMADNDELFDLLYQDLREVSFNRYNLEVFLSIVGLYRQNLAMIEGMNRISSRLEAAHTAAQSHQAKQAVEVLDQALDAAIRIRDERNQALREATATWQKSWLPRVEEVNGRRFFHDLDDAKDHLPDRTVDMSYLVYRELILPLGEWYDKVMASRNQYAEANQLPTRSGKLNWSDLGR